MILATEIESVLPQERLIELLKDGFGGMVAMELAKSLRIASLRTEDVLRNVWDVLGHRTHDGAVDTTFPYASLLASELSSMLGFLNDRAMDWVVTLIKENIENMPMGDFELSLIIQNVLDNLVYA
jgi:hypothetical protein